ncbi:HDOD domain-containing protein [Marinobacterium jannaschii]|uniref:HDOD domain-containing protein n=1 Tax=Marinobacterium jannaschii TaxID=64970 RepID=UPI000482AF15|nr:HDOD domain-containing protein [Marinobacterium jannaschii]
MEIRDLLANTSKLPNVPDVVRELIQALNNPSADYGTISEKIAKDQTLSLKVLRMVNSAHFGLSRKVSSIDEAVVMLGMARLKTLVIASGLAGSVQEVEGLDLKQFWSESFRVATLARWFAERGQGIDPDIAFTAGLIHNIGKLLLHITQPMQALAIQRLINESGCSRSDAEMERMGFTTPEVGEALLELWKFPPELGEAVRQHKKPETFEDPSLVAAAVNLGCMVNAAIREGHSVEDLQARFPTESAIIAHLPAGIVNELGEAMALESGLDGVL